MDKSVRVVQLEAILDAARAFYYEAVPIPQELLEQLGGTPPTDDEYDVYLEELEKLDPGNDRIRKVGELPVSGIWGKVVHTIPMGSLQKAKGTEGLRSWWRERAKEISS